MPSANKVMPIVTKFFLAFISASVRGLIFPSFWYLFSIVCPIANPIATPIAGPTPINPTLCEMMLSGTPIPENIAIPRLIHIPIKCPFGYFLFFFKLFKLTIPHKFTQSNLKSQSVLQICSKFK